MGRRRPFVRRQGPVAPLGCCRRRPAAAGRRRASCPSAPTRTTSCPCQCRPGQVLPPDQGQALPQVAVLPVRWTSVQRARLSKAAVNQPPHSSSARLPCNAAACPTPRSASTMWAPRRRAWTSSRTACTWSGRLMLCNQRHQRLQRAAGKQAGGCGARVQATRWLQLNSRAPCLPHRPQLGEGEHLL